MSRSPYSFDHDFEIILKKALSLDAPYIDRVQRDLPISLPTETEQPKAPLVSASVLILFARGNKGEPNVLYIKRSDASHDVHKGQMAFPGGRAYERETPFETAQRETEEEVGISGKYIKEMGQLPDLITVTGFLVHPIIGVHSLSVEEIQLRLDGEEISATVWIPLERLLDPHTYALEMFPVRGTDYPIHVYTVPPYRIWGATGSMTKNLLDRLLAIG